MKKQRDMNITTDQKRVLDLMVEMYVRIGLGQASEFGKRLNLIHGHRLRTDQIERINDLCSQIEDVLWEDGEPWKIDDEDTSLYTLNAALLELKMGGDGEHPVAVALEERIKNIKESGREKIQ